MGLAMKDLANSSSEQWQELWLLVTQLDLMNPADMVETHGGGRRTDGIIEIPLTSYHPTISRIEELLYDLNVVQDVNWTHWMTQISPDLIFDAQRIRISSLYDTVCLLTGIIRSERFGSGAIAASLSNGGFSALLNRLRILIIGSDPLK